MWRGIFYGLGHLGRWGFWIALIIVVALLSDDFRELYEKYMSNERIYSRQGADIYMFKLQRFGWFAPHLKREHWLIIYSDIDDIASSNIIKTLEDRRIVIRSIAARLTREFVDLFNVRKKYTTGSEQEDEKVLTKVFGSFSRMHEDLNYEKKIRYVYLIEYRKNVGILKVVPTKELSLSPWREFSTRYYKLTWLLKNKEDKQYLTDKTQEFFDALDKRR